MTAKNRISVSFDDRQFGALGRLSAHTQRSKAELIRTIVEEFLEANPDRFRLKTDADVQRTHNIAVHAQSDFGKGRK